MTDNTFLVANPTTVPLVVTVISLGLTVFFTYYYVRTKKLLDEIWAVDTYSARDLQEMCTDDFSAIVEVEGEVQCANPMNSTAGGIPCCWCRTRVAREVRTGRGGRAWVTEMDRTQFVPFDIKDETGTVSVVPDHCDIDSIEEMNRTTLEREPWFEGVGYSATGEFRITEEVFLPGGYAFVHGEAKRVNGVLSIGPPDKGYLDSKTRFFLVSRLNQAGLMSQRGITATVCFWGAIISFLGFAGGLVALYTTR